MKQSVHNMEKLNLTHQRDAWQNIWKRQGLLPQIIDWGRGVYNWFFRRYLRAFITPTTTFLELGCGSSTLSLSLAPELQKLVGIDNAESAIELSQKNAKLLNVTNSIFELGDCLNLSYADTFDIVWSQGLMEHFDNPQAVALEHYKATRHGGVALISVPYKYSYHTIWYTLTRPKILRSLWPWTDQTFLDKDELLAIGKSITANARVHLLQPLFLGIAILELRK